MAKKMVVDEKELRDLLTELRGLFHLAESQFYRDKLGTEIRILDSVISRGESLGVVFSRMLERMEGE